MRQSLLLLVLGVWVCGCATHVQMREPLALSRCGLLNDPEEISALEKAMTDRDIAILLDADIRPKLPTTLAITALEGFSDSPYRRRWGYYPRSRYGTKPVSGEELEAWEKALEGQEQITGVQPVSPLVTGKGSVSLHDLRVAAARMNCELLLVYLRSDSWVDNYNDAAVLYWTLAGLWLVPGNVYEHRTVMQAIVVDCRTGAILGTATGDCYLKRAYVAMYGDIQKGKLRQEAPQKALTDLQEACKALFRNIAASAARPAL